MFICVIVVLCTGFALGIAMEILFAVSSSEISFSEILYREQAKRLYWKARPFLVTPKTLCFYCLFKTNSNSFFQLL
ncbi:hypothetical protein BTO16_11830 [Polaribacter glomeratus]|uniref:Uncharacterized protein n=1 Tax=Polaribacter glomeratus TaxID=102 RepID=A0A2S7WH12_9FLAO|nr:hypothetical protein BTO16_11830 [Polaribacter glomeratus]